MNEIRPAGWPCACGGVFVNGATDIDVGAGLATGPVRLAGAKTAECSTCGSRVYDASTLLRLERVFDRLAREDRATRAAAAGIDDAAEAPAG